MPEGELLVERRKYPRWSCSLKVRYKALNGGKTGMLSGFFRQSRESGTVNISGGGAVLVTDEELNPGDRLLINIMLKSTESAVKIIGEVSRVEHNSVKDNKKRAAVKFIEIKTESDEFLHDLIRQKMRFAKNKISEEEALALAQREYFLKMLDEELRERGC
ncbi:MAG: PilZ domain-containing protein [Candidatus Firestonebacteria bacterium]